MCGAGVAALWAATGSLHRPCGGTQDCSKSQAPWVPHLGFLQGQVMGVDRLGPGPGELEFRKGHWMWGRGLHPLSVPRWTRVTQPWVPRCKPASALGHSSSPGPGTLLPPQDCRGLGASESANPGGAFERGQQAERFQTAGRTRALSTHRARLLGPPREVCQEQLGTAPTSGLKQRRPRGSQEISRRP